MIRITQNEMKLIAKYVASLSGICLDQRKAYLVESRCAPLLEELGCSSYTEFYNKIRSADSSFLNIKLIDAITTKETLFFRDTAPFELLKHKIIPDLIDKKSVANPSGPIPIRIWSAACSTGQEVYSIAIILKELVSDLKPYSIRLLGTDISDAAVTQASYGYYNSTQVARGICEAKLRKYFEPDGRGWRIKDEIRGMATFRRQNLMGPFVDIGRFDIILCRNVAIYLAPEDRCTLFDKMADVLAAGGYLIIGASESLPSVKSKFELRNYLRTVFYQLKRQN
ncbi:MAG: protein-glutamate O-methyltransferase CheR [Pseudomonadota bacterium]